MIKEIIVHLDGSADDEVKIVHAGQLAGAFGAHVRGVYTHLLPDMSLALADLSIGSVIIDDNQQASLKQAVEREAILIQRLDTLPHGAELRRLDVYADNLPSHFATEARTADLVVALRPFKFGELERWPSVIEATLFRAGRPLYIVPDDMKSSSKFDTILIAWSDTRESARAVAEAMPFLKQAQKVIVTTVDTEGAAEERHCLPGTDIARYLERHGVTVEFKEIGQWDNVAEALLNETQMTGADMVVLGAYGHSRLSEWLFGGVTRDFLTHCKKPMLMAH